MEIMIARLVCPVRVGVGMAAREKARKGARGCGRTRTAGVKMGLKKFFLRGRFAGSTSK